MSPAYSVPISKPTCFCGKKATETVFNTFNARVGDYCLRHARERVAAIDARHVPNDGRVHPREAAP